MKKQAILIIGILACSQGYAAKEQILWGQAQNLPSLYIQNALITKQGLVQTLNSPDQTNYQLQLVNHRPKNKQHIRYQLMYKGIPVWGYQVIYHLNDQQEPMVTGLDVSDIEQDLNNVQPILTEEEAKESIIETLDTPIRFEKIETVIFIDNEKKAHLAYHLELYTNQYDQPVRVPNYMIDANDGSILKQWDNARHEKVGQGLGGNAFSLPYRAGMFQYGDALPGLPSLGKFDVQVEDGQCKIGNNLIQVINLENVPLNENHFPILIPVEEALDFKAFSYACSADSLFINYTDGETGPMNYSFSPNNDTMYFAQTTYEMYRNLYNVKKPFGDDLPIRAFTHIGEYDNAFAVPSIYLDDMLISHQQLAIGNGDLFLTAPTQTVIAHEMSHLFTDVHSALIYDGQSGAINEAFSDMAAIALQDYISRDYPWYWNKQDWGLAREARIGGEPLRYMDDPTKDGYSIDNAVNYHDDLNVHHTSGVFNKAFYILANKPDWSIQKAFQVMIDANRNYWSPIAYYDFAACGVIKAAEDREYDINSVIDTFAEVGVNCPLYKQKEDLA